MKGSLMSNQARSFWTSRPAILAGTVVFVTAATVLYFVLGRTVLAPPGSPASAPRPVDATPRPCGGGSLPDVLRIVAFQLSMNAEDLDVRRPLLGPRSPADDLDFIEIIMAIEEQCGVTIQDSELSGEAGPATVEALARLVDQKLR